MSDAFGYALRHVASGAFLSADAASAAFHAIMRGEVSEIRISALLSALAVRRPTVEEITGAVLAMRAAMRTIRAPEGAIDVCGTGGDGLGTLNISTAVAFVVAGCGVPVAKHGNRNMSSRAGAADVLEALGVRIDLEPADAEVCLAETGFCFLFAPKYHPAMKHVASVRRELGFRTIFNLLGPLSNPAGVRRQLIGVFSRDWIEPMASVLMQLGAEDAWVVHSADGMDEVSIAAPTDIAMLHAAKIAYREVRPADAHLAQHTLDTIRGGDAQHNANAIREMLDGSHSAFRDIVVLNAAAALIIAGKEADLHSAARMAEETIDSGRAKDVLARAAVFSASPVIA
ncbi:MAG TPA: anthranilate phosphoribosyltransferase [Rhizomicrobium sp.]